MEHIAGPDRLAVRRPGAPTWQILSHDEVKGGIPIGASVEMDRADRGRRDSSSSQRGLFGGQASRPAIGARWHLGLAVILFGGGLFGYGAGAGRLTLAFAGTVTDFKGMGLAIAVLLGTILVLRWAEGAAVGSVLSGDGAWVRFLRGLQVEPVAWRLGAPFTVSFAPLALAFSAFVIATGWHDEIGVIGAGLAVGAILYLLQALYALQPGPGAAFLEALTGHPDIPVRLRWALVTRFVPVPAKIQVQGVGDMVRPAIGFAVWASATGGILYLMADVPDDGATLPGRVWQMLFVLGLIAYTLWLAWRVAELFLSAMVLRPGAAIKPVDPSPDFERTWGHRNPFNRHLPTLRDAHWRWGTAPRGAILIHYGAEERHFLWMAEGKASVVGRTPAGDPELIAELRGGGGFGEIALLENTPRMADVIAQEPCVVAILDREEFESVTDSRDREWFRDVVSASQCLARARTFSLLPPDERGHWVAEGEPHRIMPGEVIIRQDERSRWLGIIVRGKVGVSRDGEKLATLGVDEVFGEMAWLGGVPRNATVTAEEETLVWRWSEYFLDREVGESGMYESLQALAEERT
jgi:CRP-like cAMP-binding protein